MKIFFLLIILIFFVKNTYALDIDESIKSTIKNNLKVKIALERINESRELVIYATGEKLPTITSVISGTYLNSESTTITGSTSPERFTDSYKIIYSQNLYDFGISELEIERSKIIFNDELILFNSTIQDLILDAINGYLTVINYEKSLEANKKNYDSAYLALEETKTRFNIGSATLYDLQNAEASFVLTTTNLFEAKQNLLISKKSFEKIVGMKPINLVDVLEANSNLKIDAIIQNALKNNLDLLLISNDIVNKEILVLKEKRSKKPSLDLTGTGLYSDSGRIDSGTETSSGSIALTLTIPLFQKGQDNSNIRKYQSQILQAEMKLKDEKENLEILILNTFKDYQVNLSQMNSNIIVIKSVETSLNSLQEEYKIGTKTISDLAVEEEKLLNAKVDYLNSKKNYLINYFKLKSLDGSLINLFEDYLPKVN